MKFKKDKGEKECLMIIANLVISIFAIAFMISWEAEMVSGNSVTVTEESLTANSLTSVRVDSPALEATATPVAKGSIFNPESLALATKEEGSAIVKGTITAGGQTSKGVFTVTKTATGYKAVSDKMVFENLKETDLTGGNLKLEQGFGQSAEKSQGFLSKMFSPTGGAMGLLKAAGWAMTTYMVVGWIAKALGVDEELTKALVVDGGNI